MKYVKTLGYVLAADILSLFIGMTLASSSSTLMRLVSAVCTLGILICLLASFAFKTARDDLRNERSTGTKTKTIVPVSMGITASLPAVVNWIVLYISHSSGSFDYYKWHKIISAYFLQICNFIDPDASTSALSGSEVMMMLPLTVIPFLAFVISYTLAYKGIISESEGK
ncbi:MAG: hypothetical protein IJX77_09155 [Ruminococcus sp.]|nr:hypothetical protein [Ruminococcus sp.]